MTDAASALSRVEIFSDLSAQDRGVLADEMTTWRCKKGEILFREGDAGNEMYVVSDGSVGIYVTAQNEVVYIPTTEGYTLLLGVTEPDRFLTRLERPGG